MVDAYTEESAWELFNVHASCDARPRTPKQMLAAMLNDAVRTHSGNASAAPAASMPPEACKDFENWWQAHGQWCRAGGGEYEKTFAYRAWEAAIIG